MKRTALLLFATFMAVTVYSASLKKIPAELKQKTGDLINLHLVNSADKEDGKQPIGGYTLILMDCKDYSEVAAARNYIVKLGGTVAIIGSKNVMLGWIDPSMANQLIGQYGITAIHYHPIDLSTLTPTDRQTIQTVAYFNSVTSGAVKNQMINVKEKPEVKMDYNDCLPHPTISRADYLKNLEQKELSTPSLKSLNLLTGSKTDISLKTGNSDVMVGTVAVALFMVESNGEVDQNLYTWSSADEDQMYQSTLRDLNWWSSMATKYGKTVTFTIVPHYHTDTVCQQSYEPILHSSGEDNFWINPIMNKLGFTIGDYAAKVEAYNAWLSSTYHTDWAYSIFFAYNPSPAPNSFTNGYGAYSHFGGPFVQICFSWFMQGVYTVAHETGHIFWAPDEYSYPGYGGCTSESLTHSGFPNGNCEASNANSVDCMMSHTSEYLCAYTPAHIGWKNMVPRYFVETEPLGLQISVNNKQSVSPQEFPWGSGSEVNISVVSPQILEGKKYEFLSWNDGGARSHSITVPDTSTNYIAKFKFVGEASPIWTIYQKSNALPTPYVNAVAIDGHGDVWVGTPDGLSKFDGKKWITFKPTNSGLPANDVRSIAIDAQGNIWIGTMPNFIDGTYTGGGLAKFDGRNWTVYNTLNSGLNDNNVQAIAIDRLGNKWIGTMYGGLAKFDDTNWTVYTSLNSGLPNDCVNSIVIDRLGNKWIGTSVGLAKLEGSNWKIYNSFNSGLPNNTVMSIAIDSLENKWIGTFGGLAKFDETNWMVYSYPNSDLPFNSIRSIAIDNSGNKWIGTRYGVAKFDGTDWTIYNTSNTNLPGNSIMSIIIDGLDNKWIGTQSGLAKFDGTSCLIYNTSMDLPNNTVTSIAIDDSGNKWVGTGRGLTIFDGTKWTMCVIPNLNSNTNYISSISIDDSGTKWIGTYDGLVKFDGTTWTIYNRSNSPLPDNMIMSITIDDMGNKWIGTMTGGLVKFYNSTWTVYNSSNSGLPINDVRSIAIDSSGNKWIGTLGGGIAKFDGINWKVYNSSNSGLQDNMVTCIVIDNLGQKWICLPNKGLFKFDDKDWTIYNSSNSGLTDYGVSRIIIDRFGNKWIGGYGLIKYDGTNWTVYSNSNSGLPINNILSIAIDSSGRKWIATDGGGLAVFDEGDLAPVANAGSDQTVTERTTITLDGSASFDPNGNSLTYKWTAPPGITLNSIAVAKPTFIAPEETLNTNYTFSLIVNDGMADSPEDQVVITVQNENKPPIANAGIDQYINEGATVTLDGSSSSDSDGNTLTYKWTAPSGITLRSITVAKPTFTSPEVSTDTNYTFSLVVNDGKADSPVDQVVITVRNVNKAPVAQAGSDQSVNEGATVSLDGSLSSDPDGDPLTYKWTSPDGITMSSTTVANPTFTSPEVKRDSTLTFSMLVNDGIVNSLPATVKVTVVNIIKDGVSPFDLPFFKIYPNPTTGIVNIDLSNGISCKTVVLITSLMGAEIYQKEIIDAAKFKIDLSKQVDGVYLLKISNSKQQFMSKIVIRKE